MIDHAIARGCLKALGEEFQVRMLEPGDPRIQLGVAIVEGLAFFIPGASPVIRDLKKLATDATANVSVTFPAPGGIIIAFSRAAVADPVNLFATGVHEFIHAKQIRDAGAFQSGVDYLGSEELRAEREAEASGAGLFARTLVTGTKPSPEDASIVRSDIYHLTNPNKDFARAIVKGVLNSVDTYATPPFSVVSSMLRWMRANAPNAIQIADYR